jgi:hypothetical protein
MFLTRRILRPLCAIVIGGLLFAQAAFATRPCVDQGMSAAAAVAASQEHDCCEPSITEINLCVANCTDSANHSGRGSVETPAMPLPAALPMHNAGSLAPSATWRVHVATIDPPPTIRFCRLLI